MERQDFRFAVVTTLAAAALALSACGSGSGGGAALGSPFHTAQGIRCGYASSTVTCTLADGRGASVTADGMAKQLTGGKVLKSAGAELASGAKLRRGTVECGNLPDKGLSCYSVNNGHGFFLSPDGSNLF